MPANRNSWRHPLYELFLLAGADSDQTGLSPERAKAIILQLVPSLAGDLETIIDGFGDREDFPDVATRHLATLNFEEQAHILKRAQGERAQGAPVEAALAGPESSSVSFSDQLRAEMASQAEVARERFIAKAGA